MSYYEAKMNELGGLLNLIRSEKDSLTRMAQEDDKRIIRQKEEVDLYRTVAESQVAQARSDLSRIAEEKAKGFPWLARAYADYFHLQDMDVADALESKKHPAQKAAESVKEIAAKRRVAEEAYRILKYELEYYENLFPWLVDFRGEDLDDLIRETIERKEKGRVAPEEPDDPAKKWVAQGEWDKLPTAEIFQKALDRWRQKPKSKWEIGRDYERYVGYLYEKDGYEVHYHGIVEGFDDLGRDLICTRGRSVEIVQCKHWSKDKQIHEKHICQLHGTFIAYTYDNPTVKASARFVTSTALSERARGFAQRLGIKVEEGHSPKPYPCIKCNVSRRTGEKIYHLPFDQQYDRTIIEQERYECYVETVAEAEQLGFRRAFRWRGEGKEEGGASPA